MGYRVPLEVTNFATVTPSRVTDDANNQTTELDPIDIVAFLSEPQAIVTERGKRWVQDGILRVRKKADGSAPPDLQDGDQVPLPEGVFGVVGGPGQNRVHSMTGEDFGWVRYRIRKGG